MGGLEAEEYDDNDYIRYYQLYSDVPYNERENVDDWEDPDELRAQDEISDHEEGIWRGYQLSTAFDDEEIDETDEAAAQDDVNDDGQALWRGHRRA